MTEQALVLAQIACGVTLLVSGVAKVRDGPSAREAFTAMGVPTVLNTALVARAFPWAELALGALLLVTGGWPLVVAGALTTALFAVYWVLVGRVLRRDDPVDCHCFGSLGSAQVTRWTLARNTLLVALALLTVAYGAGGSGLLRDVDDLGSAGWTWVAMTLLVAALAALVVGPGAAGPETDADDELLDYEREPIPFAMLEDDEGNRTTLRRLAGQQAHLLVFLSIGCGACKVVAGHLEEWQRQLGPVRIDAVFTDQLASLPAEYAWEGVSRWYDVEGGAGHAFTGHGRPTAVLLGADGWLAGGPVNGSRAVGEFVDDILAELTDDTDEVPEQVTEQVT